MSDFLKNDNIICKKCGIENIVNAKFCINCGEKLEQESESDTNPYYVSGGTVNHNYDNSPPDYTHYTQVENAPASNEMSIASMVCGILSMVCCLLTVPLSITSIVLGIISLHKKYGGRGMAIAGIVISGISILLYGLIWATVWMCGHAYIINNPSIIRDYWLTGY